MTEINHRILLRSKPTGIPQPDNFIADSVPVRAPAADEVLLETIFLSIDPAMRSWMSEAVPLGTQVRVVNQPFLFGWHQGQLYLQAYTVFEDDSRNWSKAQKALLLKSMSPRLEKLLKAAGAKIDWDTVTQVANAPRGLAVAVSGSAGRSTKADGTMMSGSLSLRNALRSANVVPPSSVLR